jgi:hypothetical protein
MMTVNTNRLGLVLAAVAMLAAALPAMACSEGATRLLQVEANDNDRYVTRAVRNNSATVPHRPESDIDFPRR